MRYTIGVLNSPYHDIPTEEMLKIVKNFKAQTEFVNNNFMILSLLDKKEADDYHKIQNDKQLNRLVDAILQQNPPDRNIMIKFLHTLSFLLTTKFPHILISIRQKCAA